MIKLAKKSEVQPGSIAFKAPGNNGDGEIWKKYDLVNNKWFTVTAHRSVSSDNRGTQWYKCTQKFACSC